MPFRRTIGISLALLMTSAGAFAQTREKTASSYHPAPPPNAEPGNSSGRSGKMRLSQKRGQPRSPGRYLPSQAARLWRPRARIRDWAAEDAAAPDPQWGPMHVVGAPQIGTAAWYDLVGRRTSSGERLDTVTPTAAHLSLPLGSCAKVTNLDTGQSVVVKINDRGPYSRRFIIDLSPRAAQELGMRHAGVAAVAVEPVAPGPSQVVYRSSGTSVMQ
jgi:rare lipoprotein A